MHFSRYFLFFEKCEEEFYRSLGFNFRDTMTQGLWFPRVEASCEYKRPARFNDLLIVELRVLDLREKSVRYGFTILNSESSEMLARGYIVAVVANKKTGKATAIPKVWLDKLVSYVKQV